jgi:hypothetical protein
MRIWLLCWVVLLAHCSSQGATFSYELPDGLRVTMDVRTNQAVINLVGQPNSTYQIEASEDLSQWISLDNEATIGPAGTYAYTDARGLSKCFYRVLFPALPATGPAGLGAVATSSSEIELTWTDNSNNEDGFRIERSSDGGYTFIPAAFVGTDVHGYTDTGLAPGRTYHYRVCALNAFGDSPQSNTAEATTTGQPFIEQTFVSIGALDGRVTEFPETSNTGAFAFPDETNSAALRAGDFDFDLQHKTILSFDTSSIPDNATIVAATLRLRRGTVVGTNPFTTHGTCFIDIKGAGGFGGSTNLQTGDFQAPADATQIGIMSDAPNDGDWSSGALDANGLAVIDKTGITQFRIYFSLDDDDNGASDYIGWYSGDNATPANRPVLELIYY